MCKEMPCRRALCKISDGLQTCVSVKEMVNLLSMEVSGWVLAGAAATEVIAKPKQARVVTADVSFMAKAEMKLPKTLCYCNEER